MPNPEDSNVPADPPLNIPGVTPLPPPSPSDPVSTPIPTTAETLAQLDAANQKIADKEKLIEAMQGQLDTLFKKESALSAEITCPTCGTRVSPKES